MRTRWISWTNVILGLWLLIVPFASDFGGSRAAIWNSVIVGVLIAAFSLGEALGSESPGVSWTVSILGIWVIFAPHLLGYAAVTAAFGNHLIVGLVIAALAAYQAVQAQRHLVPRERH